MDLVSGVALFEVLAPVAFIVGLLALFAQRSRPV